METAQSVSFYQVVQQRVDGYLSHINLSSKNIICYVTVFGLGFLVGAMFKRYGMMIMSWLIGIVLFVAVLNYLDLVLIQTANIKLFLHIDHVHSLDDLVLEIKNHIERYWIESIIGTIAILLGFKLG